MCFAFFAKALDSSTATLLLTALLLQALLERVTAHCPLQNGSHSSLLSSTWRSGILSLSSRPHDTGEMDTNPFDSFVKVQWPIPEGISPTLSPKVSSPPSLASCSSSPHSHAATPPTDPKAQDTVAPHLSVRRPHLSNVTPRGRVLIIGGSGQVGGWRSVGGGGGRGKREGSCPRQSMFLGLLHPNLTHSPSLRHSPFLGIAEGGEMQSRNERQRKGRD